MIVFQYFLQISYATGIRLVGALKLRKANYDGPASFRNDRVCY